MHKGKADRRSCSVLCNPSNTLQPPPVVACREFSLSPYPTSSRPKKIVRVFENPPKAAFSNFSPNETVASSLAPLVTACSAAVQPRCIPLQNFAFCAMADPLQSPTARLGCRFVCTTSGFAQKKDARPVGGRGISAFAVSFFLPGCIFCGYCWSSSNSLYIGLGPACVIDMEIV